MPRHTWVPPESRLDPEQRAALIAILGTPRNNIWIKGFAGSGKSILLVHAMRRIVGNNPESDVGFVVFTRALVNLFEVGRGDEFNQIPVDTLYAFNREGTRHDVAFVDEVQDVSRNELEVLSGRCGRVIAAGDNAQSIYEGKATPAEIVEILNPTEISLTIIHRITTTIYEIAKYFGTIELPRATFEMDVEVPLWRADNQNHEAQFVWATAREVATQGSSVAVLLPNGKEIIDFCNGILTTEGRPRWSVKTLPSRFSDQQRTNWKSLNEHLSNCGVPLQYLGSGAGDLMDPEDGNIRILTYSSSKGLDFNTVFLPRLNRDMVIWGDDELGRTLFFVAVTRSRQNLHLSFSGNGGGHRFVEEARSHMVSRDCPQIRSESDTTVDDGFDGLF